MDAGIILTMKTLTVLTDTFNRSHHLFRCYESLKKQTYKDFVWIIIDDGSTDNTKDIVNTWINESIVEIRYFWQENKGMNSARNLGNEKVDTELSVWIDSGDYINDNAVERITKFWLKNKSDNICGIVALNAWEGGAVVGNRLPEGVIAATMPELYEKYKIKGDKKVILRADLAREYPLPVFKGEKFFPESYKFFLLAEKYKMLLMNEVVSFVVPSSDSMSIIKNKVKQYISSPHGFIFYRKFRMKNSKSYLYKFRQSVHYIATSLILKNINFIKESPCPKITILAIPLGILLYLYIKLRSIK